MIETHMQAEYGGEHTQLSVKVMSKAAAGFNGVSFRAFIGQEENEKYDNISLCKTIITVREQAPTAEVPVEARLPEETIFYGSEYFRIGFGVGASGVKPYHDEMYSTWFGAAIRAEMRKAVEQMGEDEIWLPD
jgi:hypothetical protein